MASLGEQFAAPGTKWQSPLMCFVNAAKQWPQVAWGEPTEFYEVGVTPGYKCPKSFPSRFGGVAAKPRWERCMRFIPGAANCSPRLAILTPGYLRAPLRSCYRLVPCSKKMCRNHGPEASSENTPAPHIFSKRTGIICKKNYWGIFQLVSRTTALLFATGGSITLAPTNSSPI